MRVALPFGEMCLQYVDAAGRVRVVRRSDRDYRVFDVYDDRGYLGDARYQRSSGIVVMEPSVDVEIQVAIKEACKLADRKIQIDLLPMTDAAEVEFSYDAGKA